MMARFILGVALLIILAQPVHAGRFFGNASFGYDHYEQLGERMVTVRVPGTEDLIQVRQTVGISDDISRETLLLNYEDVLFYKNLLRFSALMYRREQGLSDRRVLRPTFTGELRSFGYFLSSSYSPYTQVALRPTGLGFDEVRIVHRDWRNSASISYPKLPSLTAALNTSSMRDTEPVRRTDGRNRNFLLETAYALGNLSSRLSYMNLRQESRQSPAFTNTQRTYTGTANYAQSVGAIGVFSGNYTFFTSSATRAAGGNEAVSRNRNHSIAAMVSTIRRWSLSASASYSGRFSHSRLFPREFSSRNQSYSGQLSFTPLSYLAVDLTKSYQINNDVGRNDIYENLATTITLTRSLRRGINTRASASRIFIQQSGRPSEDVIVRGPHTLDSYYGSLSFEPFGYIRMLLDAAVSRNSAPTVASQRYQMNVGVNTRLFIFKTLEGRVNFASLYQGDRLRWGRSFSQNANVGVTYTPQSNISVSVSYQYSVINSRERISSGTWIGYAAYSFRRAYTLSLSANRQEQEARALIPGGPVDQFREVSVAPYTVTAQLQVNLSSRTTLTTSYSYSETPTRDGLKLVEKFIQATMNIQI